MGGTDTPPPLASKAGTDGVASPDPEVGTASDAKKKKGGKGLLSSAKKSILGVGDKESALTPMQKLGKMDAALSVPQGALNNSAGESHPTPNSSFEVGVTEDRNKKCRRTMEDTHSYLYNFLGTPAPALPPSDRKSSEGSKRSIDVSAEPAETDNGYFAIFDGHAGSFAADWCGKKLHLILEDLLRNHPNTPIPELLDQTFTSADQQLEKLPLKNSGCTAIMAILRWEDRVPNSQSATGSSALATVAASVVRKSEDTEATQTDGRASLDKNAQAVQRVQEAATRQRVLYTANVGDARIVLCRNGKALRLSYDHKGSDENEGRRVSNAGGLILNNRVNGVLAVTRALGDMYLKDLVTGHPYTTETIIHPNEDEFMILACDGLWDVCADQEAVDLVRSISSPQAASKILVDYALSRFSTDNLSVMVVRFDAEKLVSNTASSIGVQAPASTVSTSSPPKTSTTSTDATSIPPPTTRPSEADTIVEQARASTEQIRGEEAVEVKKEVMKQIDEEEKEAGPTMVKHDADEDLREVFGGAGK